MQYLIHFSIANERLNYYAHAQRVAHPDHRWRYSLVFRDHSTLAFNADQHFIYLDQDNDKNRELFKRVMPAIQLGEGLLNSPVL